MSTPAHAANALLGDLAAVVRRQLDADGLSQREACTVMGVPRSVLGALLSGADVRLSTVLRVLDWLDRAQPELPDTLTPASRNVLLRMRSVHGLGQCYLRVEQHGYGLLLPDGAGTLGELSRARGLNWPTWGELEARGLVIRGDLVNTPPSRARRNRRSPDVAWQIALSDDTRGDIE